MILAFRDHCLSGRKTNTKINLIEVENYSALNLTSNHITNLAMDKSKIPKNCFSEVWYITFTILISTIKKYRMEPRVATGRNSSRAKLILTSVSAATASFSLTSSAVSLVVFSTATRDSSSTNEPYGKKKLPDQITFKCNRQEHLFLHITALHTRLGRYGSRWGEMGRRAGTARYWERLPSVTVACIQFWTLASSAYWSILFSILILSPAFSLIFTKGNSLNYKSPWKQWERSHFAHTPLLKFKLLLIFNFPS